MPNNSAESRHPRAAAGALLVSAAVSGALLWWAQSAGGEAEPHPWLAACLALHGAGAALALVLLGWIAGRHAWPLLRGGQARVSGLALFTALVTLALSGLALYYTAAESWRAMASRLHKIAAVLMVLAVLLHFRPGRWRR